MNKTIDLTTFVQFLEFEMTLFTLYNPSNLAISDKKKFKR